MEANFDVVFIIRKIKLLHIHDYARGKYYSLMPCAYI
jgi:hypothetical protein